ncbi:MAG TPA: M56 family metallopeptidase [Planctomycetota bacterium]|nr:M56 family metallopeptidase [Planctomycetota bacterium]
MIALLLFVRVGLLSGALWLAGLAARRLQLPLRRRVGLISLLVLILAVPLTLWLQSGLWNVQPTVATHGWIAPSPVTPTLFTLLGYALMAAYLAGVALGLLRFGLGISGLVRMKTVPAPSAAQALLKSICPDRRQRPELRVSADCSLPFTTRLWPGSRGVIVLPVAMAVGTDAGTLGAVLRHELQHLTAQDPCLAVLSRLTCAVFWPIPFVHALSAQLEEIQEAEADAAAVAGQPMPVKALYAECLIALATRPGIARPLAAVCRAVGRSFVAMESRIRLILSDRPAGPADIAARRTLCRGVAALLVLSLPVIFVVGVSTDRGSQPESLEAGAVGGEFSSLPAGASLDRLEQVLRTDAATATAVPSATEDALTRDEIRLRDGL